MELVNRTGQSLDINEYQAHAPDGKYHKTTVPSGGSTTISTSLYRDRSRYSGRCGNIVFVVGGKESKESLTPEMFLKYSKLTFKLVDGRLCVSGVANSQFWCFGPLGKRHKRFNNNVLTSELRSIAVNLSG